MKARILVGVIVVLALVLSACASQPAATPADQPAKPAEQAAKPAQPAAKPAEQAAKPAEPAAKPTESAKPAQPAAKPVEQASKPDPAVESFYKGKTVTMIVSFSAGGGYDLYSRLLARHLGKHIPGNPTVIVQNMTGGGSMVGANHLYSAAAKDGTVIGTFMPVMMLQQLTGGKGVQFDSPKYNWIGSIAQIDATCVSRTEAAVKKFDDLFTTPLTIGATGPGSNDLIYPKLMNNLLGTKFNIVPGYPGTNDMAVAIERNEVQGACGFAWATMTSSRPDWLKPGSNVQILVQTTLRSHPQMSKVPLVMDYIKDENSRIVMEAALAPLLMGRPYVAPPGTPPERVEALRKALMDAVKDPALIEEAAKSKLDLSPLSGKEVQEMVERSMKVPKDKIPVLAEAMK